MNEFKEQIQRLAHRALPNTSQEQEAIRSYGEKQLEKYGEFHENPYVRDYFNHLVAAIMISQYENYEQSGINIPYRYKAHKSTRDKVNKRLRKATVHYNENGDAIVDNVEPLLDIFAMEVVSRRRPTITTSSNTEIQELLEEQKQNQAYLEKFQSFKRKLLINDLKPSKPNNYRYDCSQWEYYRMCAEILDRLKQIVDPDAIELMEYYNEKLATIQERFSFLKSYPDENITIEDLEDPKVNFFDLLSEYEGKFYNKTELAILTEQITSLFEDNPLLEGLGVKLADIPVEKKRNSRGYESNFVYLDTPIGRVECQLQTEDQYRFANYGFAAHTKMKGKKLNPVEIPDDLKPIINRKIQEVKEYVRTHDVTGIDGFRDEARDMSPNSYLSRMDDNERGRVMTIEFGDYSNYKKVISQVSDDDTIRRFLYNYFARLYPIRDVLFEKEDRSFGFIRTDVEEYMNSEEFEHFKEIAATINKDIASDDSPSLDKNDDNSER